MKTGLVWKILKWTAIALGVVFAALQLVRPARTNPPVDQSRTLQAHARVPPEVASILDRSCNDCHSHQTRWPWYSNVAPISWFVINHVNEGRDELNFSDWAQYSEDDRPFLLKKICREVQSGAMPLRSYLRLHHEAELSSEDVTLLCDWADAESRRLSGLLE
ncbi:MAG TPA: heme-binding domain-containing protein [Pyrinomonadaceae bacterium]|nr:heme-binding domain-containing protein [Pyrinomonadaceae bacterium]